MYKSRYTEVSAHVHWTTILRPKVETYWSFFCEIINVLDSLQNIEDGIRISYVFLGVLNRL